MEWIIILHVAALAVFLTIVEKAPIETANRFGDEDVADRPHRDHAARARAGLSGARSPAEVD